ncbi:hypothetical protein B0H13DRAFT_2313293 [Mycena leptocephala]|nr:hypothetical protein B0H13DRAFT_2313293 [Mycena leptocephala]
MRCTISLVAAVFFALKVTADIIAFNGNACDGTAGGNAPATEGVSPSLEGTRTRFIVSTSGHTVVLFQNAGCTGEAFNFGFNNPGECINVNTGTDIEDQAVILRKTKDLLSSKADYFIHHDELFATYDPVGARPANDNHKMYGIRMSFSSTEKPSTADEYTEKQNPLAIARLENLQLDGRGWIIILDFPEYPNTEVIDYSINLNK